MSFARYGDEGAAGTRAQGRTPPLHQYTAHVRWGGNTGRGTADYAGYGREYTIRAAGKPDLAGSADRAFRGDAARHNPEDLFVSAIAACHMLFYLALCARSGVCVRSYEDGATGVLELDGDGGGQFREVTLRPIVMIADGADVGIARTLHDRAHELCFIARSCSVPIRVEATIRAAAAAAKGGQQV